MIKRLIKFSLIFTVIVIFLSLNLDTFPDGILVLPLVSLIFAGLVGWEIYKKYKKEISGDNSNLKFTESINEIDSELKQISSQPFLFGLEKKFVDGYSYYFDENFLYVINKNKQQQKFDLKDITAFERTYFSINKRRIWKITVERTNESDLTYNFMSNYTIFNKNFKEFYESLKRLNPTAVKSEWTMWKI